MADINGFIGKQIGNYRVVSEISSGAFGSVYQAQHFILRERTVAIKILHAYLSSSKEREQFLQEAQFLEKLKHHHILSIIDVGFSEGFPYLMAEYASRGSLREHLKGQSPRLLSLDEAGTILSQIGQALHYAHQQNIIHRDLKPENILFNAQGDALLADFGIATMLSTASIKHVTVIGGTPPYMAPEQFQGMVSKESDQYALGCIAYELLTGRQPFSAPDFISMGFKHITEQPLAPTHLNPHVSLSLEQVILKAMAKQRADRYANVSSFISALQSAATFAGHTSPVYTTPPPTGVQTIAPTVLAKTKEQWIHEGDSLRDLKRYEEALRAYEQAIRLNPNNALGYARNADALNGLKRYEEALSPAEQAIRLDPNNALGYARKAQALNGLKRYEEALGPAEQAIRLDPNDALGYDRKAYALLELKRYEEALRAAEQAIRLDPNNALSYDRKTDALNELKRYEEALRAAEQAIRLDPNNALYYERKAYALSMLGRSKKLSKPTQ